MQASQLPASMGFSWIRQGYRLFRRQPVPLLTWALTIGLIVVVASMMAPIGPLFFVMFLPCISVMTLEGCRRIEGGGTLSPYRLFSVLQTPGLFKPLFQLGLLYLLLMLGIGLLAFMPFAESITAAMDQADDNNPAALYDALQPVLVTFALCYVLLAALFWFAPGLIAWEGLGIRRALFYSMVAFWRNKGAFFLYVASWGVVVAAIEFTSMLLVSVGLPAGFVGLVQLPVNFVLSSILYASVYYTYTSVLGEPDRPPLLQD